MRVFESSHTYLPHWCSAVKLTHATIELFSTTNPQLLRMILMMMKVKTLIDLIKRSSCQFGILREQHTMCQLKMALFGTACPSKMDFMTTVKVILEQRDTQF